MRIALPLELSSEICDWLHVHGQVAVEPRVKRLNKAASLDNVIVGNWFSRTGGSLKNGNFF